MRKGTERLCVSVCVSRAGWARVGERERGGGDEEEMEREINN